MNPWRVLAQQLDIDATSEEQVFRETCRSTVYLLAGDRIEAATEALMARLGAPFGLFSSDTTHPAAAAGQRQVMLGPWRQLVLPGLNALAHARGTTVPTEQPVWRGGRCIDCAWCHALEDGTFACGKARGRVDPEGHVCGVQEARFGPEECASCGACCHRGHRFVQVHPDDPTPRDRVVQCEGQEVLPRPDGACVYLTANPWRCAIYDQRPGICRHYEVGGDSCLTARRTAGVTSRASPLEGPPGPPTSRTH